MPSATPIFRTDVAGTIAAAAYHCERAEREGADMHSSARLNLNEARERFAEGDLQGSWEIALRSLSYSVGILHPDYQKHETLQNPGGALFA